MDNSQKSAAGFPPAANKTIDIQHPVNIANTPTKASADLPIVPGNGVPDMRTLAVALARKGYHVFRLQRDSKLPLAGSHAHLDATNDPGQVHKQWTAVDGSPKDWNIGTRGKGLLILDFDPKNGQTIAELVAAFTEKYGKPPDSAVVKTPRGGRHLYLRCPKGVRVPTSVGKLFPDVDVRGENGYAVGPGSHTEASPGKSTATGNYTRPLNAAIDAFPAVSKLTEAPPWLIEAAWRAGNKSREWGIFLENDPAAPPSAVSPEDWGSFEYPVDTEAQIASTRAWLRNEAAEAVEGHGGREATKRVIHWLGDAGLTYKTAMPLLCEEGGWDATKCFPPWSASREEHAKLDRLVRDLLSPKNRDRPIGSGHGGPPAGPRERAEDCFEIELLDDDWQPRPRRDPWRGITMGDGEELFLAECERPLVAGLLEQGTFSVWVGAPKVGKSFVMLSMADAIAAGEPWAGHKTERGLAVYVAAEGGRGVIKRLTAIKRQRRRPKDHALVVLRTPIDLHSSNADAARIVAAVQENEKKIGMKCRLIVIDTVSRALSGADEDTKGMSTLIKRLDFIRDKTGAHLAAIHHTGKDTSKGARGSSTLSAALDSGFLVTFGNIKNTEQRDLELAENLQFRLRQVLLGVDRDGDPVISAIAEMGGDGGFVIEPTGEELDAFNCLCDAQERVASYSAEANNNPPMPMREWTEAIKAAAVTAKQSPPNRQALGRLRETLIAKKLVRKIDGLTFELASAGLILRAQG